MKHAKSESETRILTRVFSAFFLTVSVLFAVFGYLAAIITIHHATGVNVVLVLVGTMLYLLPSFVAAARKVPNAGSVCVINLLLGWSLVGWAVSLAMAVRSGPPAGITQVTQVGAAPEFKVCPDCAEEVRFAARKCRFCGHMFEGSSSDVIQSAHGPGLKA